jgi:putative copper export protein
MSGTLNAITGWLLFTSIALSSGAVIARAVILPRVGKGEEPSSEWLLGGAARVGFAAALLLPVALALYFLRQLLEFRDPFVGWTEDASLLLTGTAWGRTWIWGAAASVLAPCAFLIARSGRRIGWWVAAPMVLALGALPAYTGHAAGEQSLRFVALAADTLHVWAASGWIGGLAVVLYLEWCWRQEKPAAGVSLLPRLVPAFSPVAMACVGTLVLTGSYTAWLHVDNVGALVSTAYGRTLTLKLLVVSAVLGLGAVNFLILTPKLGEQSGNNALCKAASVEILLAQIVLFVTSVLVRTSPMDH